MNARRTVILIVAVVVAAVAAVGILNYIEQAETSTAEASTLTEVWVVRQPIPKGTSIQAAIDAQLIGVKETPQDLRPLTAVVDPAVELAGLVAVTDLPVDWPVVTGSFVSPKIVDTGITDRLEETGLVTVTFSVDAVESAAYLIEPGDFVNVLTDRSWRTPFVDQDPEVPLSDEARIELATQLQEHDSVRPILTDVFTVESRVVYQKAEVLAIGTNLIPDIGDTAEAGEEQAAANLSLVTLAVPPEAVQVLLNVGIDNLYLSLVPDDYKPRALPPLDPTTQVLPGERSDQLTPYAGYDVKDPTEVTSELTFSEAEDRIGTATNSGSDTESGTDTGSRTESGNTEDRNGGDDNPDADNTDAGTQEDGTQDDNTNDGGL